MKCTFVVRLGPKTNPAASEFEGSVEEVDTGKELRFQSRHELLEFLAERFRESSRTEAESGPAAKRRRIEPE